MGALVRGLDWSTSPLGPPGAWPRSLRAAADLCLMSPLPMAVCWGPTFATFYNDACRALLGAKHPRAMGRPLSEIWSELAAVKPLLDGVIASGNPSRSPDIVLEIERNGGCDEAWFTVSNSAIPGDSGRPAGVLVALTETTERVLAERRLLLVRRLAEVSGSVPALDRAWDAVQSILDEHRDDLPFSMVYVVDGEQGEARLAAVSGVCAGHAAAPDRTSLGDGAARSWPLHRALAGSGPVVVDDLSHFGELPGGSCREPARGAVLLPVPRPGRPEPVAVLVAGVSPRRPLDAAHL